MASNYLAGWVPVSPTIIATPITFETIVRGLCGVEMPDGRGLLVWSDGSNSRGAVTDSPEDWLVSSSVDSADAFTIAGNACCSATCFEVDGELYVNAYEIVSSNARSRIYKADDPADPAAGWTAVGTALQGVNVQAAGSSIPFIADSGRWTMIQPTSFFTGIIQDITLRGVTSTDNGVNWTVVFNPGNNSAAEESRSRQLAAATDGTITWTYQYDATTNLRFYNSQIDLTSITSGDTLGDPPYQSAFLYNGTDVFSISAEGSFRQRVADGIPYSDWTDTGEGWSDLIPGPGALPFYVHGIIARHRVFIFADNYVLGVPPICEPVQPDVLYIPFKDRLQSYARGLIDLPTAHAQLFENFKVIERWAQDWMTLAGSADRCLLHVPFKEQQGEVVDTAADTFEAWKVLERWGQDVSAGECGCACDNIEPPADRCRLFIAHKDYMADVTMTTDDEGQPTPDLLSLLLAGEREFDAFKTFERWGNRYVSAECGCTA